jgi:dihydrolipoamide dehydrogenase
MDFDVAVIGAGPGGYVAAIRAQLHGLKAVCIEKEKLGGVCLNWGCIPSKALLKAAEHYLFVKEEAGDFGISLDNAGFDWARVITRSRKVADQSEKGVKFLFKKYGVTSVSGNAVIEGPHRIRAGEQTITAKHIIVATGARARTFPGIQPDGERILTYREAIVSPVCPKSIVVLGSGAIGLEFAWFFSAFGAKVTVVEGLNRIAPLEDGEISAELAKSFKKRGIEVITGRFCEGVERYQDGVRVKLAGGTELQAEYCLVALGIAPNSGGLGLESVGATLGKGGFIEHDRNFRCGGDEQGGVFVVGDVAGPPALAHTAYMEAHVCVDRLAGKHSMDVDYTNMPAATYCQPQIASVGLTEEEAKKRGLSFTVGRFPFAANGKARGVGHTEGLVKVLVGSKYGEILGAHLIGHDAAELLPNFVMARGAEVTAEHFLHTVHAHPTLGEAMYEAVAVAMKSSCHI